MTNVITEMLNGDPRLTVVGSARNGKEGIEQVISLKPDVVTLDMEMPVMNGTEFLRSIMETHPVPVVMLSAYTREGARETIEALKLGAVDFVQKPSGSISLNVRDVKDELVSKIILASEITCEKLKGPCARESCPYEYFPSSKEPRIVTICTSTGGPRALCTILSGLPKNLNACILIVQHMPGEFTAMLAERLNRISPLDISEAKGNETLTPGKVYIAPGGKHMEVSEHGKIVLSEKPKKHSVRPSCDVTLRSVAPLGERVLAIVLTGMGRDGSEGLPYIKRANGTIIVEDASTSVIFGMPKAAIRTGFVDKVIPLYDIAKEVIDFAS
jgi:two-component system chemotaxis response regulator CheB